MKGTLTFLNGTVDGGRIRVGRRGSRLAGGALALLVASGATIAFDASAAFAANQDGYGSISGSMEGSLTIEPGDWISAGYAFTIPGIQTSTVVGFYGASVAIPVSCTNGGTTAGTITITLASPESPYPTDPYSYPSTFSGWAPYQSNGLNGNESVYGAYEGAVQAPNLCSGGAMYNSSGATFTAPTVTWSTDAGNNGNGINVQFHYRDPNAIGQGNIDCASSTANPGSGNSSACGASWSGTQTVIPNLGPTPQLPETGLVVLLPGCAAAMCGLVWFVRRRRHLSTTT